MTTANYSKHPTALVQTARVGAGAQIGAFTNVSAGASVGAGTNIGDHVLVEDEVIIGDRVTIRSGAYICNGTRLEDDVVIGPNATFVSDRFPRGRHGVSQALPIVVRHGASVGANATVLGGTTVGPNAVIGAGAVVTRDVPPNAIVAGNPARIRGYVSSETGRRMAGGGAVAVVPAAGGGTAPTPATDEALSRVGGARLIKLPMVVDMRGSLAFGEIEKHLPFTAKRIFVIYGVPSKDVRGEHAHRKLEQLLICVKGSIAVVVDDGTHRAEVELGDPHHALYIPPMVWGIQYKYTSDAVLVVLASDKYDAADYIRDYDEFERLVARRS